MSYEIKLLILFGISVLATGLLGNMYSKTPYGKYIRKLVEEDNKKNK